MKSENDFETVHNYDNYFKPKMKAQNGMQLRKGKATRVQEFKIVKK